MLDCHRSALPKIKPETAAVKAATLRHIGGQKNNDHWITETKVNIDKHEL